MTFVKDNAVILLILLVIVLAVIKLVDNLIKWLIVALLMGVFLYVYNPNIFKLNNPDKIAEQQEITNQAVRTLLANQHNVKYEEGKNGSYVLTADDSVLYGTYQSKKVTIVANGHSVTLEKTPQIEAFIQKFRKEHEEKMKRFNQNPINNK